MKFCQFEVYLVTFLKEWNYFKCLHIHIYIHTHTLHVYYPVYILDMYVYIKIYLYETFNVNSKYFLTLYLMVLICHIMLEKVV